LSELLGNNYVNVNYKIYSESKHWEPFNPTMKPNRESQNPDDNLHGFVGMTQAGCFSDIQNQVIVWNAPFECGFRSTTLLNWPQMILQVMGPDIFGRSIVIAYGNVHLPTQPG